MNYSISYNTVLKLRCIIEKFKPDCGYQDLAKDIRTGIKYTKLVSQRNFLEKLLARGEATPEVITLARRRYSTEYNNNKKHSNTEKRIMHFRINEKEQEMKKS